VFLFFFESFQGLFPSINWFLTILPAFFLSDFLFLRRCCAFEFLLILGFFLFRRCFFRNGRGESSWCTWDLGATATFGEVVVCCFFDVQLAGNLGIRSYRVCLFLCCLIVFMVGDFSDDQWLGIISTPVVFSCVFRSCRDGMFRLV